MFTSENIAIAVHGKGLVNEISTKETKATIHKSILPNVYVVHARSTLRIC